MRRETKSTCIFGVGVLTGAWLPDLDPLLVIVIVLIGGGMMILIEEQF
ncbi:MAG: hypothetical protein ACR2RE_06570 [Geminicoccaceae bacterium]